nr:MAG TPA: hypothetical protein [Caudoviricetes sp.]
MFDGVTPSRAASCAAVKSISNSTRRMVLVVLTFSPPRLSRFIVYRQSRFLCIEYSIF